ncbi:MAG: response regulator [Candidatus Zixiibacteriota bacterium]
MAKILVIDDSKIIRDLLIDFLTEEGHEVDAIGDSAEGIQQALKSRYDVCFCDLHIPKKNGYQVFCEVSAVKPELQFIFTDSLPDKLFQQAQESGVSYCLRKPFDLEQLRDVLHKVLRPVKTK